MDLGILVSSIAAILTTGAFVPQALHIIRYKETRAISLHMYVAFATGVAFNLINLSMLAMLVIRQRAIGAPARGA